MRTLGAHHQILQESKKRSGGAGEMAQLLRALATPPDNASSILSIQYNL